VTIDTHRTHLKLLGGQLQSSVHKGLLMMADLQEKSNTSVKLILESRKPRLMGLEVHQGRVKRANSLECKCSGRCEIPVNINLLIESVERLETL
jgi:hypothetical protein